MKHGREPALHQASVDHRRAPLGQRDPGQRERPADPSRDEPSTSVAWGPPPTPYASWTRCSHAWSPKTPGPPAVRMRTDDPSLVTRRLDSDYYVRTIEIDEV